MSVTIGALRESAPNEKRVSLVPEVVDKLVKAGARVMLQPGAGERAGFSDTLYKNVVWASPAQLLQTADVVLTVQPLSVEQIGQLRPGTAVVGFLSTILIDAWLAVRLSLLPVQTFAARGFPIDDFGELERTVIVKVHGGVDGSLREADARAASGAVPG